MLNVILFEFRYRLRQPVTWIYFALLLLLGYGSVAASEYIQLGLQGQIKINAPIQIARATIIVCIFSTSMSAALIGASVYRDFEAKVHELFFTTRLTKSDYLIGRFLGSYIVTVIIFASAVLGMAIGSRMPWLDHSKLLPFDTLAYLTPILQFIVPDVFFISAFLFVAGALTRNLLGVFSVSIVILVGWIIAIGLIRNISDQQIAAVIDPFGIVALGVATRYWTPAERNGLNIPWSHVLLLNRLLWSGVGLAVFAAGYQAFRFDSAPLSFVRRKQAAVSAPPPAELTVPAPHLRYDSGASWSKFWNMCRLQFLVIVRNRPFLLIGAFGIINVLLNASQTSGIVGTPVYPVTRIMTQAIATGGVFYYYVILIIYAGTLVFNERVLKLDQIYDSLPIPTSAIYWSKLVAIIASQALLLVSVAIAAMAFQLSQGYFRLQPDLYFTFLFGTVFPGLVQLAVLAFFVQTVVNNKFAANTIFVLVVVAFTTILPSAGLEDNLYIYSGGPTVVYSDMNGFGPFVAPLFWFSLYWTCAAIALALVTQSLWVRGEVGSWKQRLATLPRNLNGGHRAGIAASLMAMAATGSFIYYNTHILNPYVSTKEYKHLQADYERKYRKYDHLPQPRIVSVTVDTDLYPEKRQFTTSGTYAMINKTSGPISDVHVTLDSRMSLTSLSFNRPSQRVLSDKRFGYFIYHLAQPLPPGAPITMRFNVGYLRRGFVNGTPDTDLAENGTFINNSYLPYIGYQESGELGDNNDRKEQHLPPKRRMPRLEDVSARVNTYLSNDSDWINFDATVSTDPDQIAIAPGYLQREWTQNGRRYFHYTMDTKILNFYSFLSARYLVFRDHWNKVTIEIYYQPGHAYNIADMDRSIKDSLTYYTTHYAPYQFHQVRIIEFPAYATFAQSFPNTIPYSEGIGFIAKLTSPTDIDFPYYVTAHEVAHQWWAHQVIGANCQGATMLSETLAQYSAYMVMEHKFGANNMRKFLKYDLDKYLSGRAQEAEEELPLSRVEDQQYIHYNKGALVMYALRDYIGEANVDSALSTFDHTYAYKDAPYPVSEQLISDFRARTPANLQYVLDDLFEKITLYDNQATDVTAHLLSAGTYRVTIKVLAKKYQADGKGNETEEPMHDSVDIGIFAASPVSGELGKPLLLEKQQVSSGASTFVFTVHGKPAKAGIDPYNKLIDRVPDDNTKDVVVE